MHFTHPSRLNELFLQIAAAETRAKTAAPEATRGFSLAYFVTFSTASVVATNDMILRPYEQNNKTWPKSFSSIFYGQNREAEFDLEEEGGGVRMKA